MNKFYDLYSGISNWDSRSSGYDLLNETLTIAKKRMVNYFLMPETFDIDTVSDIQKLRDIIDDQGKLDFNYKHLHNTYNIICHICQM